MLWVEIDFPDKSNIICGVIHRQHNSTDNITPQSHFKHILKTVWTDLVLCDRISLYI